MSESHEITIRIDACVFGGRFTVTTEPRSIDRPSQEFRTYADARACADALHEAHGWTIVDRAGEPAT